MDLILKIIFGLIFLSVLVFIHEFGHYIVGKKSGIGVVEFAIGFGPKIWSTTKNDTVYSIRCIPLGGFTAFEGEDEESDSPTAMNNVSVGRRIATILAGPLFNIVTAILISTILLCTQGEVSSQISMISEDGNARAAGLQVGDVITDINGRSTEFSMEVSSQLYMLKNSKKMPSVTVNRNGEDLTFSVPFNESGQIGIAMAEVQIYNPFV
ncbi:MAG: site-2 protease family protein, partial [Clostridia bacterium]|nr:site-2 protease family protein [Clostridia bacterium]